jgi:two-component system, LytTR family, sensor kinase
MPRRTVILLVIAAWTFVAFYFAVQSVFNPAFNPRPPWSHAVVVNFTYYYLWAICTPVVVWLGRRFPFDRWSTALGMHALASLALTALQLVAAETFLGLFWVRAEMPFANRIAYALGANFLSSVPTYWLILAASLAVDYYRKYRDRETRASQLEAQLSQAQLQALKMQLNPHFLFNTLNSVSSLMYTDVESADAMLARLSEFLRLTIDREIAQEIPLEEEVEFVRRYLEIEKIRFEERLRVDIDIDGDARGAIVPSLALQPLVENAIHHGIAPRREGGAIAIRARRENGQLHLSVADDGVGTRQQTRERVGLHNTRARLERLYGSQQQLTLSDVEPRGVRVDMIIPFRTERGT